jgi:chromosomal replication initiation ATPase DnaA
MSKSAETKSPSAGREASPVNEQTWLVQAAVAHVTGVALKDLCAATRSRPRAAFARQLAMYLSHVVFRLSLTEVAIAFGRDPSTAAHAFRRIEEMREDPEFDRTLNWLEAMLRRTAKQP